MGYPSFLGIALAVFLYLFNPLALRPDADKTIAVVALMIIWWITKASPMPAVALMPMVSLPLLQISTIEKVAQAYSNLVIFLFMGGFMIGLAIPK